jgi:4'-phosphopantetheinyl transferase
MTDIECRWEDAPRAPLLEDNTVHVFHATLERPASEIARWTAVLAPDERDRANAFVHERTRARYVAARAQLRILIGHYLDVSPEAPRFSYTGAGKPSLTTGRLMFNVSHSAGRALFAFSREYVLGVDLEQTRHVADLEQIALRFFSPRESTALRALPAEQRHAAFFRCWTRKEAFVKATGWGIAGALDRFDVSLAPDEPATLLSIDGQPELAATWSLHDLAPAPGYAGALAVQAPAPQIRCWRLPE